MNVYFKRREPDYIALCSYPKKISSRHSRINSIDINVPSSVFMNETARYVDFSETPFPGSIITSRKRGNSNRSSKPRGSRTTMVMSFKAGSHLRFAEALVAIWIYANAFTADAQVAPDIASPSGSASATPTLNQRVPVMPGGSPRLASHAPTVGPFEQEVTSLENRRIEFSQRPIIFYGSSSIRLWKTLSQDFTGYPVVNCGFGGSRLGDCVRYVSRLVLSLKPAAVVLYAGDNDLAQGALPDQAFGSFRDLYRALRGYSEQMPIAYISVKPSPARIRYIDNILRFNQMVKAFLQSQPATKYIDIYGAMLGPDQKPNPALFVQDQIHLSGLGYQILRRDVSTFLSNEVHLQTSTTNPRST
jgi:lysophospholipase L1-like esterase